jgi:hypothetical protein
MRVTFDFNKVDCSKVLDEILDGAAWAFVLVSLISAVVALLWVYAKAAPGYDLTAMAFTLLFGMASVVRLLSRRCK